MKKIFKNRLVLFIFSTVLVFIFLFLSFFVWIIAKSDIIDMGANRINLVLLGRDLAFFVIWLCIIPFIIYCIKKYRKECQIN